jgi:hypothetical protein
VAAQAGVLAGCGGRVLEQHGHVQAPVGHAHRELLHGALDRLHPLGHHARDGRGHQGGQCAGEAAHAQRPAVVAELAELGVGQRQALGQCVGVLERDRARVGEGQAAGPAVQQPCAELALQGGDLLRYRGLGQRQVTRRRGERSGARDGAEGEQPARIQH